MRFDLYGTGFIDLSQLQFLMTMIQYHIPALCDKGEVLLPSHAIRRRIYFCYHQVNQQDEVMYTDFSSFGSGPNGTDRDASEAQCRRNYTNLVRKITKYERAKDVYNRLCEDGIQIQVLCLSACQYHPRGCCSQASHIVLIVCRVRMAIILSFSVR